MSRLSYKDAVVSKCKECIYDPVAAGTWVEQVRNCTSVSCPLFPVRPGSSKPKSTGRKLSPEQLRKMQDGRRKTNSPGLN